VSCSALQKVVSVAGDAVDRSGKEMSRRAKFEYSVAGYQGEESFEAAIGCPGIERADE
jgi:hypothetical protein